VAGQTTDASNALAFAKQKVREAGLDPAAYTTTMTPCAEGWWFRFDRMSCAQPASQLQHVTVRVSKTGQVELSTDRR
jgi:hypothetical protein